MGMTRAAVAMVVHDGRRMLRDQFLLGASAYIVLCAVAMRWVVPWLQGQLLAEAAFDLSPYVALGVSYFVLVNASVLTGMVGGFLLLETREERTVKALLVTPTPLSLQLGVLGAAVVLGGFALAVGESWLVGVGIPPWDAMLTASALGAPAGVVIALLLATLASNKVEAFAVMKITSFLGLIPVGAYFLPEPLQFVGGVSPSFWACKVWWMAAAGEPGWGWMVLPGLAVSGAWVAVLLPRFRAAAFR